MQTVDNSLLWSSLYAVVMSHQIRSGFRVRWNTTHQNWVRSHDYDRYLDYPWNSEPGTIMGYEDRPSDDDLAHAVQALQVWQARCEKYGNCERCGTSKLGLHFLAPNIYGDPTIYCVQQPSYSVVGSKGGAGKLKHWGSCFGCQSVEAYVDRGLWGESPLFARAAFVYGKPLTADEVINRDWCSRCANAAHNVRNNSEERQEDSADWEREQGSLDIRRLARRILEYEGD